MTSKVKLTKEQKAQARIYQVFGKDLTDMFGHLPTFEEIHKQSNIDSGERSDEWNAFFQLHYTLTATTDPYIWTKIKDIYGYQVYRSKDLPYPFHLITEFEANKKWDDEQEERYMKWLEDKLEEMFHMEEPWK